MTTLNLALAPFADPQLNPAALSAALDYHRDSAAPRLHRYMGYYRNPARDLLDLLPFARNASLTVRPYRLYQEIGLPTRLTGFRITADGDPVLAGPLDAQRKEIVIENDIAWRINTLVDFAAGAMPAITSAARDESLRATINTILRTVLGANGGPMLLQELALLGAIHGGAFIFLRPSDELLRRAANPAAGNAASFPTPVADSTQLTLAAGIRLQTIPAPRALAMIPADSPAGAAGLSYCAVLQNTSEFPEGKSGSAERTFAARESAFRRVTRWLGGLATAPAPRDAGLAFDLWGPRHWQRYADGALVDEGANPLGFVPVVAFINQPAPTSASVTPRLLQGLSEIEPLIPLQDELNTRLSDRASRVTMASFRMYLAKGLEDFIRHPVGPGQMWATDNPNASIESFGGDAPTPSEDTHITEIRQALDKISGVPPVAAGLLSGKVGNLTSAVALKITLISLLSRTQKRRAALETTLAALTRRILEVLDSARVLSTTPEDRAIDINWPSALPENELERLQQAQLKVNLGIPRGTVLAELGYAEIALDPTAPANPPTASTFASAPVAPSISAAPNPQPPQPTTNN